MGTFGKVKKYNKPSVDIDEKVKFLNKQLIKTGVVVEEPTNSTSNVYSTISYTQSAKEKLQDVETDASGEEVKAHYGDTEGQGTGKSPDGSVTAIRFRGYGQFTADPNAIWYKTNDGWNYVSWNHTAYVNMDGSWPYTKVDGGGWGAWRSLGYGYSIDCSKDSRGATPPSDITSAIKDPDDSDKYLNRDDFEVPPTKVVTPVSLDDPNYFPGNPVKFLADLLDTAAQGIDYLKGKAAELIDDAKEGISDTLKGALANQNYGVQVAASILANTPLEFGNDDISDEDKQKFIQNFNTYDIGKNIPINTELAPYSDDNIYRDESGKIQSHTSETRNQFPDTTIDNASYGTGKYQDNPLASAGKVQVQVVIPEDGSEPYIAFEDHAYYNPNSKDKGEVPDWAEAGKNLTTSLHDLIHGKTSSSGTNFTWGPLPGTEIPDLDPTAPNTGGMKDYPPGIKGDVVKTVKIPFSQAVEMDPNFNTYLQQNQTLQDALSQNKQASPDQIASVKGKGGSPYQEYEPPKKDKFVPPPKDMKKPWENLPGTKKAGSNKDAQIAYTGYSIEDKINVQNYHKKKQQNPNYKPKGYELDSLQRQMKAQGSKTQVAHYEPRGRVLSEKKDPLRGKEKWFGKKDVKPDYPEKAPPEMIDGWHPKLHKKFHPSVKDPVLKISKKDLNRQHLFKDDEIKEFTEMVDNINQLLDMQPELLPYVQQRYPANDTRLAALNYKMDIMLEAGKEYLDKHFPVNKTLFKRATESIKKNIELTDPKHFEKVKEPPKYIHLKKYDLPKITETVNRHFKKKKFQYKSWHKGHLSSS